MEYNLFNTGCEYLFDFIICLGNAFCCIDWEYRQGILLKQFRNQSRKILPYYIDIIVLAKSFAILKHTLCRNETTINHTNFSWYVWHEFSFIITIPLAIATNRYDQFYFVRNARPIILNELWLRFLTSRSFFLRS